MVSLFSTTVLETIKPIDGLTRLILSSHYRMFNNPELINIYKFDIKCVFVSNYNQDPEIILCTLRLIRFLYSTRHFARLFASQNLTVTDLQTRESIPTKNTLNLLTNTE